MEGGGWRMEGGGWRVDGGGWRVDGGRIRGRDRGPQEAAAGRSLHLEAFRAAQLRLNSS